ncbi:SsrA-binding protein SmpB [Buchnera aphidicola]|uniref:SsrA-binding protein SmpB n=1 Tax=Buchnera aphidicola TaxID=9 RepID=UPI003AF328A8
MSGIELQGWEVKSIRAGHVQISDGHVIIKNNEVYLTNVQFQPLIYTSDLKFCLSNRVRKLLLKKKEIFFLKMYSIKKGYTIVPIKLFWIKSWCKIKIALVKGKSKMDKRQDKRNNSWKIERDTIFKRILIK